MKIQIMSDLHREFYGDSWKPEFNKDVDYIVLAGDTSTDPIRNAKFFNDIAEKVNGKIISIPGNHEYYGHQYPDILEGYKQEVKWEDHNERIRFLNQEFIIDGDIAFLCATLWTDFDKEREMFTPVNYLNDYSYIHRGERTILPKDFLKEHKETLAMFCKALEGPLTGKKIIMVTHHGPSYQSIPEHFKSNPANGAYVSSLEWFVEKYKPIVWIHGHTHSFLDYQLGPTRVICNSVGYPKENEYRENYIIEV
jgi:predicted phosphodiesterase